MAVKSTHRVPELFKQLCRIPLSFHFEGSMSTTGHAGSVVAKKVQRKEQKENRLVEKQLEKMKTLTRSFQVGTLSSICKATKGNIRTNTNDNKEDGVTKPFSRAFGEKLNQGPGHSKVLLCSQMCQYSRVFQKGDTPLLLI